MSRGPAVAIRRILVAIDASPASLAAAAAAAELAVALEVELAGLFIEETALLELAGSPLVRQLSALTAESDRLDRTQLERQLRAQAGRVRRDFDRLAARSGVRSSFRVVRGQVAEQIVAETGDADLVSLGRVGWSLRHRRVLGSAARALLAQERRRTLLVGRAPRQRAAAAATAAGPLAIYDGSPAGDDAVELALQLGAPAGQRITVLLMGEEPAALRERLQTHLGARMQAVGVTVAVEPTPGGARRAVGRHRPGLVVVPTGGRHGEELIQQLLEETGGPLLAVT